MLGRDIPPEQEATCGECVMLAGEGEQGSGYLEFFDPVARCCTYLPELPNFLVGAILTDADPRLAAGRGSVEDRLERGVAVTPLGLGRPATYTLLYGNSRDGFGHSRVLRCPHHQSDGSCGIWPHRMSVCATWFCKYSRGAVGQRFWMALKMLLQGVEADLARWCLLRLRLDTRALGRLFPPPDPVPDPRVLDRFQLDGKADPEAYAAVWGRWRNRETQFYARCARLVAGLSWPEVLALCGPQTRIAARLAVQAFKALTTRELPSRLRLGPLHLQPLGAASCLVVTYSGFDPLRLPTELLDALSSFDGQAGIADTLHAIARHKGLRLSRDLLRKLADFEVLVPAVD